MCPNEKVFQQLPNELSKEVSKNFEKAKKKSFNFKEMTSEEHEAMINQPFYKRQDIKWLNAFVFSFLHAVAIYGFVTYPYASKKLTLVWGWFMTVVSNFGVGAGIHRLWSHRAYKAKLPLRIILMYCYLTSGQYTPVYWIRDHRVHHKHSETNADPVNSMRGFWFSHVGWMVTKRHPELLKKGQRIDLTDVYEDPVIRFTEKYFEFLRVICVVVIPVLVPVYLWSETWYWAVVSQVFMRFVCSLNFTWCVNSFAHIIGVRPYDKSIAPTENLTVSLLTAGEAWHNYHHTFPWDYKTSELGKVSLTTFLIDAFAKIGWAYDLKQPSDELVKSVIKNRGDGSHAEVKME